MNSQLIGVKEDVYSPHLPREVLVIIFQYYVQSEGVARLLTRLSKVCFAWKDAATDLKFWTTVDDPNLSRVDLLRLENLLSHTRELNVSHLRKTLTSEDMLSILPFCSRLKVINFRIMEITHDSMLFLLKALSEYCPALEKITFFSSVNLTLSDFFPLLAVCGSNLKYFDLSENSFSHFGFLMREIAKSCPLLEELHLQHISGPSLVFPHDAFQIQCPELRVLEVDEVDFSSRNANGPGFPNLETFSCRVIYRRGPDDRTLTSILHSSKKLKNLNLTGNSVATHVPLSNLDCSLETLQLSRAKIACVSLYRVITKWKHSLKCLNLSMVGAEYPLNETIRQLIRENCECPLTELNLWDSVILLDVLRDVLSKCPKLSYLDVTSCHKLPRGFQQVYDSFQQIQNLRQKLSVPILDSERICPNF